MICIKFRIKKELTEKSHTLTDFFNLCLKFKNPWIKLIERSRPSSAVHSPPGQKDWDLKKKKIDSTLMREVFQSIGIFIPYDQYQIMLSTFQLIKKRYISYEEFMRVFAKTHYPHPFVRKTHCEPKEEEVIVPDYTTTPSRLGNCRNILDQSINSISKYECFSSYSKRKINNKGIVNFWNL